MESLAWSLGLSQPTAPPIPPWKSPSNPLAKDTRSGRWSSLRCCPRHFCLWISGFQRLLHFISKLSCLVGNVADMSPLVVAPPTMSAENGRHHNVAAAMSGSQYLSHMLAYLRRDICEASAKLARWDRCLPMSSWARHDIARVADMSRDMFMTCLHVDGGHVVWGGPATRHDADISN
jgi:hypothetical protein